MSIADERSPFLRAHHLWAAGDFDGFMKLFAEGIIYIVNVDGLQVPYAMSSVGKQDLRDRLELLLHTFVVTTFALEKLVHEADHSCSVVHGVYRHKNTGEVLDVTLRLRGWVENGVLTRMEEIHDARYIEAFERFVFFMESAAHQIVPQ